MFRVPRLTLTPPRPNYLGWGCWKNIVNIELEDSVDVENNAQSQQDVDMWIAKLSDFNDPLTLAGCLWRIHGRENEWQCYFRLAPRGQAFIWWFDDTKHSSNNPYFELLFRSLRRICLALNEDDKEGEPVDDIDEWRVCIQEALKCLNRSQRCEDIDRPVSITQRPKYQNSVLACPWLDHNFYTALFSLFPVKESVEKVNRDAVKMIEVAHNQEENCQAKLKELFLQIHLNVTHLNDMLTFEKKNSSNPLSISLSYISFLEEIERFIGEVSTACNALITKDAHGYEKTVMKYANDYQPSLLRLLKSKGFDLTSISSSGKCHESDHPRKPANFVLFSNDDITSDKEDTKRQIELRNVLTSFQSLPQMKVTFPKLKRIDSTASFVESNENYVLTILSRALSRFCNCDFIGF